MRLRIISPIIAAVALVAPAAASADFPHIVTAGESLSSVAATDGLTVAQVAAANGLSASAQLVAGSTLMIPPQGPAAGQVSGPVPSTAASTTASSSPSGDGDNDGDDPSSGSTVYVSTSSSSSSGGGYVVQPGDTLSAIAARAGITVAELAASNGIDPNGTLLAGATLSVPGAGAPATPASSTMSAATQPVGAVAEGNPTSPPYPTPERVSATQVGAIASANGVPPSLAQAIGWQESGFNNDLVSTADARGVMQILPGTWDWIQRTLAAGSPLAPASAASNVKGGVLLLRSLLNSTGGDPSLAAAGYYQGLPSVQRDGLYPSTQQYVNDVMALAQRFGGG
jgi:LysM repeat protein